MQYLKSFIVILGFLLVSIGLEGQFTSVSGGLTFSSGVDYNTGITGNPGLFVKSYLKVTKRFYIVPEFSAYNKYKRSTFSDVLKTHMFQGDVNANFTIYRDKYLRFIAFTGVNATAISSKWDVLIETPNSKYFVNKSEIKPGANLGAAAYLYVNDNFDGYISAKYIAGPFSQWAVINVGTIYYFSGKRRKGSW